MLTFDYPTFLVDEDLIFLARQEAANKARGLALPCSAQEFLPYLRDLPQVLICRGTDPKEMVDHLALAMAAAHKAGLTSFISEGFDRASDYLLGKRISEPAVAGYVILTFQSIYQRNTPSVPEATVRNMAHLYLSLVLLQLAESQREPVGRFTFPLL